MHLNSAYTEFRDSCGAYFLCFLECHRHCFSLVNSKWKYDNFFKKKFSNLLMQ